jgi:hypothetical protein
MLDIEKTINDTEALINSVSKSAKTISDKETRNKADSWVANYSNNILEVLDSHPKAVAALLYLEKSINNVRLKRKLWLKNLRIIYKALKAQIINTDKKTFLFFDPNKPFTAYKILKDFFMKGRKEVLVYDGYVQEGTLDILSSMRSSVRIKILINNAYGKFNRELSKFKKEFPLTEVKKADIHDRFFIIDDKCFISGTSLHAFGGNKPSYIFEVNEYISVIFKNHFMIIWNKSKSI